MAAEPADDDWYANLLWLDRRKCLLLAHAGTGSVRLAATASRSVLGYMNEIARYCEYATDDQGGLERVNIEALNRELRRELHLSRRPPGYFVPIDLVMNRL